MGAPVAPGLSGSGRPALFDRWPVLGERIPWRPLGRFPTRIERLEGALPPPVELWVKRDDACGAPGGGGYGGGYGGNKVRKLEFIVADALARGKRRLVTAGGYGSHHVLATALYGRAAGLSVEAVVYPQPITAHVRETLLAGVAVGCRYFPTGGYAAVLPRVVARLARGGAAWVPPGGSSPTGTLGWVSAGLEIAAQIARGECPAFDVVYVALGSCGTAAGLLVGLRLAGLDSRIVGVRVVDRVVCNRTATLRLARRTARLLAARSGRPPSEIAFHAGDFVVEHRFFGGAYGAPTAAAERAVAIAAAAGLALETTYTGKVFAALLDAAAGGHLDGRRVLFVDTFSSADLGPLLSAAPAPQTLPARLARCFPPA